MMPALGAISAARRYTARVSSRSCPARSAPTQRPTVAKSIASSCSPTGALVDGVKTGSGSREPSTRPGGSATSRTAPVCAVLDRARPGQVAAGDALDRQHLQPPHQHRPAAPPRRARRVARDQVVRAPNDVEHRASCSNHHTDSAVSTRPLSGIGVGSTWS